MESSRIKSVTVNRGTYHMNQLSFGIKTASSEFNHIIDHILQGLPKTLSYFDDPIIHGATKEKCQKKLELCLRRLKKYDLNLNQKKCSLSQERIEYFNKIYKSPRKISNNLYSKTFRYGRITPISRDDHLLLTVSAK
jgi:hypothetical protein